MSERGTFSMDSLRRLTEEGKETISEQSIYLLSDALEASPEEEVTLSLVSSNDLHGIYTTRRDILSEQGVEILGIEHFLNALHSKRDAKVNIFSLGRNDWWLLGLIDGIRSQLLSCLAVRRKPEEG
ncbi:hypothetical protein ACFY4C_33355 [Actinomadura viridis]|uniref:hypothetical protein n=1 Tax=Actinomadura viridis TaxID=58110 RepID=UPI0036BDA7B1